MRASEIYRLKEEDIDLEEHSIIILKTKTGHARKVYFNNEVKKALLQIAQDTDYITITQIYNPKPPFQEMVIHYSFRKI
jgi:integrase